MDRLTGGFVVLLLVCLATKISGEIQQSASPYTVLKQAPLIILDAQFTTMNKMVVKVVPTGTIKNSEFTICLGYEYSTFPGASIFSVKKYYYNSFNGTSYGPQDVGTTINSFRDLSLLDKGDDACTTAVLQEIGNEMKLGPDQTGLYNSNAYERNPLRVAITRPDYSGSTVTAFFCNVTSCFDDSYNLITTAPSSSTYGAINVAYVGQSTYMAVMSMNPSAGVKQGQVTRFSNGVWNSPVQTAFPARDISITSWDDNDFMFCYDNGVTVPANSPMIYCRAKDSPDEFFIDKGTPDAANSAFSQVNVSPMNQNYAFVTALATNTTGSYWRAYAVTRGASAALDPRTLILGTSAVKVASHSRNGIIALAICYAGAINVGIYGFDASVFNPPVAPVAPPVEAPVATPNKSPVAAPVASTTPQAGPLPSGTVPSNQSPVQGSPVATNGSVIDGGPSPADGLSEGGKIGLAVALSAAGAGAGLFVLLFLLKKKRDKKKQKSNEASMEPVAGAKEPGSDNTYGNLPVADNGKYSNINLTANGKYGTVATAAGTDDGIAVPTSIQPSEIDKRMHIAYKSLVFVKEIGAGSYGKVYLGEWRGAKVAIKVNNTVTDVDGFLAEAKLTLGITPHPNLVQTFGVSLDGPNPCIVLEYCGGGSLDQLFGGDKGLTNEKRLEYALKIGYGLLHLHSRSIVHRDLAARNILLTNDGQPKISDFGMSRIVQEEAAKGRTKTNFGPIRWMAPECLKDKSYSLKSDVWSFGIILYELVAGKEPHEDEDQLEIALKIRDKGETPKIPDDCDPVLRECMQMCWKYSPNDRPPIEDVCAFLRSKSPDPTD